MTELATSQERAMFPSMPLTTLQQHGGVHCAPNSPHPSIQSPSPFLKEASYDYDLAHAADVSMYAIKTLPEMAWWHFATAMPPCERMSPPPRRPSSSIATTSDYNAECGFVYAPTAPHTLPTRAITPSSSTTCHDIPISPHAHELMPAYPLTRRRGSKDSNDSMTPGLTVESIIDRLVAHDHGDNDMTMIFLIFFRKFMKPHELMQTLIDRFQQDPIGQAQPTQMQERIASVMETWMSHYWNDFISFQTRRCLHQFLERISMMSSIFMRLQPWSVQPLADRDLDDHWGLADHERPAAQPPQPRGKRRTLRACRSASHLDHIDLTTPMPLPLPMPLPPSRAKTPSLAPETQPQPPMPSMPPTPTPCPPIHLAESHISSHSSSSTSSSSSSSTTPPTPPSLASFPPPVPAKEPMLSATMPTTRPAPCFAGGLMFARPMAASHTAKRDASLSAAAYTLHDMPATNKTLTKIFIALSATDIAEQLTWIEARQFAQINAREFVRMISSSLANDNGIPLYTNKSVLMASISHFNFISAWVITMLVTQPRLAKRVVLLEKFMMVAVQLREMNNYNTLMAILAGINNASILRLKQTHAAIEKRKIYKRFQSLERLMSSDRSFASYRLALRASGRAPCIPYFGIHSQDLITLAEANKDFKKDGTINWEKFKLMGESILSVMKCQHPRHHIKPNPVFLRWLASYEILGDEAQYSQSKHIEPQLRSSPSVGRLRELWQRL